MRKNPHLSLRNLKHGLSCDENGKKTRLYGIWVRMKQRCRDVKSSDYKRYGGRGIQVCNEWLEDYKTFHDWAMANGYAKGMSIERIDNEGNYTPENCTWIPMAKQAANKRNSRLITYDGKTRHLAEWARVLGIGHSLLRYRLKHWGVEKTFSMEVTNEAL